MRNETKQSAAGLSLPLCCFIVFLTLKLTGAITWSWWWVTSPLWMMVAIVVLTALTASAVFAFKYRKMRRTR